MHHSNKLLTLHCSEKWTATFLSWVLEKTDVIYSSLTRQPCNILETMGDLVSTWFGSNFQTKKRKVFGNVVVLCLIFSPESLLSCFLLTRKISPLSFRFTLVLVIWYPFYWAMTRLCKVTTTYILSQHPNFELPHPSALTYQCPKLLPFPIGIKKD